MSKFLPGNRFSIGGGRARSGARNRQAMALIDDLREHWREKGKVAIDIVFHNRPVDYLRIQTSILPKELLLETTNISDYDDSVLDAMAEFWGAVERGEIKIVENKTVKA